MRNAAAAVWKGIVGSLAIWVTHIHVIVLRLLPVLAISALYDGDVRGWLVAGTVVIILFMLRVGIYLDIMRSLYNTNYGVHSMRDDPVLIKIRRHAPLHLLAWALYLIALLLLAVV